MKPAEMWSMSDEQLTLARKDTIKHLFQLRIQSATERLETPSEIRKARKDIARLNTIQRQRELDRIKALSDEQLAQKIRDADALLKTLDSPADRRRVKRDRARIVGLLREREEAKKKATPKK